MRSRFPAARKDLEYHEREIDGDDVVFVRDPIRNVFYRYNVLQAAMLRALDGVRSYHEIVEALSDEFEVEIPSEAVDQFVASAKDRLLLDISSYGGVMPDRVSKEVTRVVVRAGFRLRDLPRADAVTREARLLVEALHRIQQGDPAGAMTALTALRVLDPGNARAAELITLIQTAYVRAAGGMTDWPTYPVFDPTRLLKVLDATLGRVLFSTVGVVGMLAVVVLGVYCAATTSFGDLEIGAFDVAVAVGLFIVLGFLHELGHALACVHYGGAVPEVGVQLMYYLNLVFYCDTSSSYLFARRRPKVVVQLAGVLSTLLCCCGLAILLAILRPDVAIYTGFAITLLFASAILFLNLIPFLKLDAYYLLCDLLRITNLRDRSFRFAKGWLAEHVLGVPPVGGEQPSGRDRRIFLSFACLAFVFTTVFVYSLYFRMLAPIVELGGAGGLALVCVLTFVLVRNSVLRPIARLAPFIVRERRRIFTARRSLGFAAGAVLLVAPWFLITWPVLVDAEFVVIPAQRADVRAQTTGRVEVVFVREGDAVTAGQPLAQLRSDELTARRAVLDAELDAADRRLALLRAGPRAEDITVARRRLDIASARDLQGQHEAELARALSESGLTTGVDASAVARTAAASRGAVDVASRTLALVKAGTRPEQIIAAEAERARVVIAVEALRVEQDLLTLRSPIDGVVATKHLGDRLQTLMHPGDLFVEIHDRSAFTAEIRLPASAPLHELAVGDAIALRPYGAPHEDVRAVVAQIRDAADRRDSSAGRARVVLTSSRFLLAHGRAGMTGHARLYGRRRPLGYAAFYLPIQRLLRIRFWSL